MWLQARGVVGFFNAKPLSTREVHEWQVWGWRVMSGICVSRFMAYVELHLAAMKMIMTVITVSLSPRLASWVWKRRLRLLWVDDVGVKRYQSCQVASANFTSEEPQVLWKNCGVTWFCHVFHGFQSFSPWISQYFWANFQEFWVVFSTLENDQLRQLHHLVGLTVSSFRHFLEDIRENHVSPICNWRGEVTRLAGIDLQFKMKQPGWNLFFPQFAPSQE